ncbi:MAG: hypothetical protein IPF56_12815 [Chloroflexi bacterium]|nr:hypothetical protein [Chloroflexota bacterium]
MVWEVHRILGQLRHPGTVPPERYLWLWLGACKKGHGLQVHDVDVERSSLHIRQCRQRQP